MKAVACYSALKKIPNLSKKDRVKLVEVLGSDMVKSLCECALNIVHQKVKIQPKNKAAYKKNANNIRLLINKKASLKAKKKILVQKGGALLPLLIAPVLGILSQIIAEKAASKL